MSEVPRPASPRPRQRTFSNNFYLLLFGIVMLAGLLFLAWIGRPPVSTAVGEPLPRLDLQPLLYAEQPLRNQDLQGKLAVIHFWGTWCPPCQLEFPEFVELARQFADDSEVVIASVSCSQGPEFDLPELQQRTRDFMDKFDAQLPTYSDSAAMTRGQLALLLPNGSLGYPTTLLVDRDGTILVSVEGYAPGDLARLTKTIQARL